MLLIAVFCLIVELLLDAVIWCLLIQRWVPTFMSE